jgi:transposase
VKKITREDLRRIYDEQGIEPIFDLFLALQDAFFKLQERVEKLEQQLSKNSRNSSKPPSTDMNREPKSLRERTGNSNGGQPGHPGNSLHQVAKPDHIQEHSVHGRCSCGRDLAKGKRTGWERRQVFDLPSVKLEATEHRAEVRECACGQRHTALFPKGADAPVQYGARIRAIVAYLSSYQLLPQKRTTEAMADLFGVRLSEGTVNNILKQAYGRLAETETAIKEAIRASPVMNADETGVYVSGQGVWGHTRSTPWFTFYFCHPRRGTKAMRRSDVLPGYTGRVIHDGWPAYFKLDCRHGLCNAHHLRELTFVKEELKQRWASEAIALLRRIKKTVDRAKMAGRIQLAPETLRFYRRRYDKILINGYRANPLPRAGQTPGRRGRKKQPLARNLLDRLSDHADEALAFMYDFNVPFDNNLSERDLRMNKVRQKISGCFRSMTGAEIFCRIRGYISTIRKHGLNAFEYLIKCFEPSINQVILLPGT